MPCSDARLCAHARSCRWDGLDHCWDCWNGQDDDVGRHWHISVFLRSHYYQFCLQSTFKQRRKRCTPLWAASLARNASSNKGRGLLSLVNKLQRLENRGGNVLRKVKPRYGPERTRDSRSCSSSSSCRVTALRQYGNEVPGCRSLEDGSQEGATAGICDAWIPAEGATKHARRRVGQQCWQCRGNAANPSGRRRRSRGCRLEDGGP